MDMVERERILSDAARRYLRGEITLDEHVAIRDAHKFDYIGAITTLVREQRRYREAERLVARRWWRPSTW